MKKLRFFLAYWCPVVVYCLVIFIQSSFPAPNVIPDITFMDKLLHFTGYGILGALFFRAFRAHRPEDNVKPLLIISIVLSCLYGASDELHQYFVPCRSADAVDFVADILGSITGVLLYQWVINRSILPCHGNSCIDKKNKFL